MRRLIILAAALALAFPGAVSGEDGAPSEPVFNTLTCINLTNSSNSWTGGSGNDCVNAKGGNDFLWGAGGRDKLRGDDGADKLYGQTGQDVLHGGHGGDDLQGGDGNDYIYAGCKGGCGQAGESQDLVRGGNGDDTIGVRNNKADIVDCGYDDDVVYADFEDSLNANCEDKRRA